MYVATLVLTSPFGWIAGQLSEINRSLPFILNIILFGIGCLLTALVGWRMKGGLELNRGDAEAAQA